MAINVNSNFHLGSKMFVDDRQSVETLDDLLALDTNIIPNGFECYVEALDCKYKYHEDYNETSTGHWKLSTGGEGHIEGSSKTNYLHENKLGYIAHRGSSILAPTNSTKAFELAGDFGYEAIELDVQYTSDGVPVIMHDSTVDATTDGTGEVANMTLNEIKSLQLDTDFLGKDDDEIIRVPTFEESVKACKKKNLIMNIDCSKMVWTEEIMHDIVGRLKKYNMLDYCFFVMTNEEQRELFLSLYPDICITWLSSDTTSEANIEYCNKYKNAFVTYSVNDITETLLEEYNNAGIPVFLYQCQTPQLCEKYADYGVRFIETDYILPYDKIL